MKVDEWTATLISEHAGQRYFFCSRRCKERFDAAPEEWVGE
ncbi:MAG TPA: YHS domain-containing protein [Gammaproteobacteria bacterium]|nr:YHS domain-containing protein [Gammaproteobacteria bacterium]